MAGQIDNSDILEAINQTVKAINDLTFSFNGPGSGSSGCGCILDGGTGVIDVPGQPDQTQDSPTEDPPPEGYGSWEDFFVYKCSAANWVVDNYIATLSNISTISGVTAVLTVALLVTLVLLPITALGLLLALVGLGSLAALGSSLLASFGTIAADLEAQKEDIVCDLFNAQTSQAARASLIGYATDAVASLGFGSLETGLFEDVVSALVTNEAINALFTTNPEAELWVGDVDCAGCAAAVYWDYFFGDGPWPIPIDGSSFVVSSEFSTNHKIGLRIPDNFCPTNHTVEITANPLPANDGWAPYVFSGTCPARVRTQFTASPTLNTPFSSSEINQTETSGAFTLTMNIEV